MTLFFTDDTKRPEMMSYIGYHLVVKIPYKLARNIHSCCHHDDDIHMHKNCIQYAYVHNSSTNC